MASIGFVVLAMMEFAIVVLWRRTPGSARNVINQKVLKREISFDLDNEKSESNPADNRGRVYVLDFFAFWGFFLLYLIFNLIYWINFY